MSIRIDGQAPASIMITSICDSKLYSTNIHIDLSCGLLRLPVNPTPSPVLVSKATSFWTLGTPKVVSLVPQAIPEQATSRARFGRQNGSLCGDPVDQAVESSKVTVDGVNITIAVRWDWGTYSAVFRQIRCSDLSNFSRAFLKLSQPPSSH